MCKPMSSNDTFRNKITNKLVVNKSYIYIYIYIYIYDLTLSAPSVIRARWGIEINGRFEAERPSASAQPPSGGRAATLTPLSLLYSTGPCCPV